MRKTLLILGQILFCATLNFAQEVVAPQGESYSNSSGEIQFTLGELMISTFENGTNGITQGFHQTKLIISSIEDFSSSMKVAIYPNPVLNQLTIKFTDIQFGYQVDLLDINGKLVGTQPLVGLESTMDVSALAAGIYMLLLKDEEGQFLKTYQIHKLN